MSSCFLKKNRRTTLGGLMSPTLPYPTLLLRLRFRRAVGRVAVFNFRLCIFGGLCVGMWRLVHQWSFCAVWLLWLFLTVKTAKMTIGVPIVTCLHRVRRIHKAPIFYRLHCGTARVIIIIIRQLIRRRNMSIKSLQGRRVVRLPVDTLISGL